jgi:para-nitrobenzyl esterase
MMNARSVLLLVALAVTLPGCGQGQQVVVVDAPTGKIAGYQRQGVQRFLGIPYAEPPVGDARWRPPVPKAPWPDTFRAERFGPWCAQFDYQRRDEGEVLSVGTTWESSPTGILPARNGVTVPRQRVFP